MFFLGTLFMLNLFINRCHLTSYTVTWVGKLPRTEKCSYRYLYEHVSMHTAFAPFITHHHVLLIPYFNGLLCAGFRMELSLFQPDEAFTQVRHTGSPVLSSFSHPSQEGVRRGGYQHKITTSAPDSTGGRGEVGRLLALRTSLSPWETASIK